MKKLKTVEDLTDSSDINGVEYLPSLERLKEEVIKHITRIGSCGAVGGMYNEGVCGLNNFSCTECNYKKKYLVPWIKHFFKITTDDIDDLK